MKKDRTAISGLLKAAVRVAVTAQLLLAFFPVSAASVIDGTSEHWKIDLLAVNEQIEARYYMAEHGALPAKYLLLNDICLYPNILQSEFDLRKEFTEYDYMTGRLFKFRVPGDYTFARVELRDGPFFSREERRFDIPGMSIKSYSHDEIAEVIRVVSLRNAWISDVRYNLEKERDARRRTGLLDLNIPIKLPKQIEWLIGDGEETRLTVSGKETITIGGTSRWCANCPVTEGRPKQQKFPDLDMEQQLTVNLTGNIGEKIHVNIDHSSMGQGMQSTNRVRLHYEGLDDEIIRSIEMGNTDLTLTGAQLISYSGAAKGLFGVKVKAQFGMADMTFIASKEEGESAAGAFTGTGGQSSESTIADHNYIKRQYFYFETPGESFEDPTLGFISSPVRYFPVLGTAADMIEVFVSLEQHELQGYQSAKLQLRACADPENDGVDGTEEDNIEQWFGILKENDDTGGDYSLIQLISSDNETKYLGIRLNQPLDATKSLAVRYKSDMGQPDNPAAHREIGDYGVYPADPNAEVLLAELICPRADEQNDTQRNNGELLAFWSTWNMMFRNIYSLGAAGLSDAAIKVTIEELKQTADPKDQLKGYEYTFVQIFGLDQENSITGVRAPDELVDDRRGIINYDYGYIQFPWFEPFNLPQEELATYFAPDSDGDGFGDRNDPEAMATAATILDTLELNPSIYQDYKRQGQTSPPNKFNIVIETTSGSRVFQLNAFDIIEGSEVVSVDEQRITRGTDYTIDYLSGTVSLKGAEFGNLDADSKVSIEYQHTPLVGGGKTSLLGVGANFNISTNSRLNASFLYNSVGTPKYNPRLGDEPTRTMAGDINGSFQFAPDWMTSLVNLLPRVDTDMKSSLTMSGEVAVSIPNPNTKGEAFLDDMEGVEDSDMLTMVRRLWYEASPPIDPLISSQTLEPVPDQEFYWFNPIRDEEHPLYKLTTSKRDLNPRLSTRENTAISTILLKAIEPQPGEWCGIMTGFAGGLDIQTAQYLEIWVNDYTVDPDERSGVLHIDIGRIDEDFHRPELDVLDDELQIDWTEANDTGFEGDDLGIYPTGGFDYDETKRIVPGINSRQGNLYHDSEDLNRNTRLDEKNEYYSLTLDLADTAIIDVQRDFSKETYSEYWNDATKTGGTYQINRKKSWRMYRLDLSKVTTPSGIPPRIDAIQHMRVWVEDISEIEARAEQNNAIDNMIEIGEVKFVGSRWEFNHIRDLSDESRILPTPDMKVRVGTVNNKDNPSLYYSPYPVDVEDGLENREQSLLIEVENFERDRSFRLMKRFIGNGHDFQQYREIEFFVRGDNELTSHDGDLVDFYLQFAYDSLNFYEVVVPLSPENAGGWNNVKILLSDLTDMKIGALAGEDVTRVISDVLDPSKKYDVRLRGNPSLFRVKYLFAGLRNRSGVMIPRGQVWFNDIVLGNVRKDVDHAERIGISANFGNIVSLSGRWQHTGPEFRSLGRKSGSGMSSNSYNFNAKSELNHFIPTGGFQLPVTFNYTRSDEKPKYLPQKDVEITDPAAQDSLKSVRNAYDLSIGLSRRGSKNAIMKNLFDNLKTGFKYGKTASFSPTNKDTSWTMSGYSSYQIQFSKDRDLSLIRGIKWRYWLTSFSAKANGSRSVKRGYTFNGEEFVERAPGYSCGWNNEVAAIYDPFESLKFSFRRTEDRNLALENKVYGVDIGQLTRTNQSLDMIYNPGPNLFFFSQFNPRFEYRSSYEEDLGPSAKQGGDPQGTRNVYGDRDISIVFDIDIGKYAIDFGKAINVLDETETVTADKLRNQRAAHQNRKADFERMMQDRQSTSQSDRPKGVVSLLPDKEADDAEPGTPPTSGTDEEKEGSFSDLGLRKPRTRSDALSSPADSTVSDSTTVDSLTIEEPGSKKADPKLAIKHFLRFIGRIQPIKSSIDITRRNQFDRLYERADFAYQVGLSSLSGANGALGGGDSAPLKQTSRFSLDFRSGMSITSRISASFKFNYSKRTEESATKMTTTDDLTWPDVNLNWKGLENWPLLRDYIKQSELNISYIRQTSSRLGEEADGFRLNPNWNMTWKNSLTSNVSVSYFKKTTVQRNQEMWEKNWSVNVELKYDIRGSKGFGIPLPFLSKKKMSFESTLTTTLNVMYTKAEKWNIPASTTLSFSPRFTYTFSRNVSGNLTATYRRSAGGVYGYVNHEVGLHATAEFKF